MTIGLPIEIKVREYLSKVFLAFNLVEKLDQDVLIGEKNKVYNIFKNTSKFYLISKGGPVGLFKFFKKKYNKNFLGLLDEEAPLPNLSKHELIPRIHEKILNNLDDYYAWGLNDKNLLINYLKKNKTNIKSYGHPKFDLLKKKNIGIFRNDVKKIKKKYKNLIFIPSSFSLDQVLGDRETDEYQIANFLSDNKNIKNNWVLTKNIEKKNYNSFLKLLIDLAKNNPKYNFVFRPHPKQLIDNLNKKIFEKPKNFHIIYEGTITPWIISCDLYIHYGCTSSIEAAVLNKKIILFIENERAFKGRNINLFKTFGKSFNNYDKCKNYINYHLKYDLKKIKSSKVSNKYISNSSKLSFVDAFINNYKMKYLKKTKNINPIRITEICKSQQKNRLINLTFSWVKNVLLKNYFFSKILKLLNPNLMLSKNYKLSKLDKISLKEIRKDLNIIRSNIRSNIKIKIYEIDNNLFLLSKKK